jgi:hypothetical protein
LVGPEASRPHHSTLAVKVCTELSETIFAFFVVFSGVIHNGTRRKAVSRF